MLHDGEKDIYCDGGNGDLDNALGHPKIFLTYEKGCVMCPYCGKEFKESPFTHPIQKTPHQKKTTPSTLKRTS